MTDTLALSNTETFAFALYDFIREIDTVRWRKEMGAAAYRRLSSLEKELSELIDGFTGAGLDNFHLYYRLTELAFVLREYAPDPSLPAQAMRRQMKRLFRRLLPAYEGLASGLREEEVVLPTIRSTNWARIGFHIGCMFLVLALMQIGLAPWILIVIAGVAAATCWTLETIRKTNERLNVWLMQFFRRIAHPFETIRVNSATWLVTSLFVLSWVQPSVIASVAITVLGVGDPVAGLVGRRWGRTALINQRTLEGSFAFAASSFFAVCVYLLLCHSELSWSVMLTLAATGAIAGALAELVSIRLDDNLMIPICVAAVTWAMTLFVAVA